MNPPSHSGIPLRMKIGRPGRAGCPQPAACGASGLEGLRPGGAVRTPRPTYFRGNRPSPALRTPSPVGRERGEVRASVSRSRPRDEFGRARRLARNLAAAEHGSATRRPRGSGRVLRLTEPRSTDVRFRGGASGEPCSGEPKVSILPSRGTNASGGGATGRAFRPKKGLRRSDPPPNLSSL